MFGVEGLCGWYLFDFGDLVFVGGCYYWFD